MPELPAARLDRASHHRQQRPGHRLPPTTKNRLRRRMIHRPQALHATQVMDTVHQQDLTPPHCSTEYSDLRGSSHGSIPPRDETERRLRVPTATRAYDVA